MLAVKLSPHSQLWRSGAPNSLPHSDYWIVNCTCLLLRLPYSFKRPICSATWAGNRSFISGSALSLSPHIQSVNSEHSVLNTISWRVLSIPIHAPVLLLYSPTWSPFFSNHFCCSLILPFQSIGFMSYYYLFLEKGMEIHSSILAWRIPWTEEPDGLQSMGWQKIRHIWVTNTF